MKPMTLTEKIDAIVNLTQPAARGQVEQALRECAFTSTDDPALNALLVQALLAGQPLHMVTDDGVGVATAADMARLGDRVHDVLWSILRLKWHTVIVAFLLFFATGTGATVVAFKMWPERLAPFFDLPKVGVPVTDPRLVTLDNLGADFVVKTGPDGTTYIYFDGKMQPLAGKTNDGLNFLYFKP
jgi:hypothetical protein